ncbi:sialate O-acetylesterase [Tsuneonella sp. HG094]
MIAVRGSAPPGTTVLVSFNGATVEVRADQRGRWVGHLPAQSGGTIGSLSVTSSTGERIEFSDVAVGEVWLCSGQSNMDLPVRQAANPDRTANEATGQSIRLLKVGRAASAAPADTFSAEIPWSPASAATVANFSAACWHMGRSLGSQGIDVPIGLIHSAWGGSTIEDWMSADALRASGIPEPALAQLRDYAVDPRRAEAEAVELTDRWAAINDPGSLPSNGWFQDRWPDADWATIEAPGQWERSGVKALTSYDGVMWFRRSFELSTEQAAGEATLGLGRIDERDRVWVNGHPVGATSSASIERRYSVPAALLRAGANSIAVRVVDEMGAGGFSGPARAMTFEPGSGGAVSLAGAWRYRTSLSDQDWRRPPPFIPWVAPRGLSMAWNGMIAPLQDFPLAGVIWYQGESNTARPGSYRRLLENWRKDWRRKSKEEGLPMIIVQLPGFGPPTTVPTDSAWAQLREVQRQVARDDPRTGLAVTIDLGVSSDIHPAHKDIVGQRIAAEAMRVAYGAPVPVAPSPTSARRQADGVKVQFAGAAEGLVTYGGASPTAFEWCTAAKACRFTDATSEGSAVTVAAPPDAAFIRYAWQGFPVINLYGRSGLPVVPFEIAVE